MEPNHTNNGISGHCHLVAISYPGRGHINPMMSLCRRLASGDRFLRITFVVTEEWLGLLSSSPPPPKNIRLCTIPNVLPSEKTRGANYLAFIKAILTKMEAPVEDLVRGLDPPVDAIVADSLLPWAPAIGKRMGGIPVSSLFPESATMFLALHHLSTLEADAQSPIDHRSGKGNECLDYLPRTSSAHLADFMAISTGQNTVRIFIQAISWFTTAQSLLFTSSYELESRAIDALRSKLSLPIYPIGPSIPHSTLHADSTFSSTADYSNWLDCQPTSSVLYVCLGSFLPISETQMDEMAAGLRMSGVRFLWVAREDSVRIQDQLSGELGLVVAWSDQLRVLCHPSVGGFLTHCGWNSTLEGVYAGVPMLTFPLMWDQFPDSKMIVDEWKVGLRLKKEEEDEGGFVGREEIANVVRKFMDLEREESKEMRRRARELKDMCGKALEEKGSSSINLDAFARGIVGREKDI